MPLFLPLGRLLERSSDRPAVGVRAHPALVGLPQGHSLRWFQRSRPRRRTTTSPADSSTPRCFITRTATPRKSPASSPVVRARRPEVRSARRVGSARPSRPRGVVGSLHVTIGHMRGWVSTFSRPAAAGHDHAEVEVAAGETVPTRRPARAPPCREQGAMVAARPARHPLEALHDEADPGQELGLGEQPTSSTSSRKRGKVRGPAKGAQRPSATVGARSDRRPAARAGSAARPLGLDRDHPAAGLASRTARGWATGQPPPPTSPPRRRPAQRHRSAPGHVPWRRRLGVVEGWMEGAAALVRAAALVEARWWCLRGGSPRRVAPAGGHLGAGL